MCSIKDFRLSTDYADFTDRRIRERLDQRTLLDRADLLLHLSNLCNRRIITESIKPQSKAPAQSLPGCCTSRYIFGARQSMDSVRARRMDTGSFHGTATAQVDRDWQS